MDLRSYLSAIRKGWWLILLATALGVGGAYAINERATPVYESSVTFYVSVPNEAAVPNAYTANQYAVARMGSYSQLLTSDLLAERVVAASGVDLPPAEVADKISASSDVDTVLVTATISDTDPERSLAIAGAVASQFGPLVDELDNRVTKDGVEYSTVDLVVTSGPTLNPEPVSPRTTTNLALGLIVGLALGLALAILRTLVDNTVRSQESLRTLTGLPVVGGVARDPGSRRSPVLTDKQTNSKKAEAFRAVRTNLQFASVDNPVQVLAVTSAVKGEGKTSVAANLAIVYAQTGRKVLLLEADLREPQIANYLDLDSRRGLADVLAGDVFLQDAIQQWGSDGLSVLPSGSSPSNPSELLGSQAMTSLLAELRGKFDVVVVDTPAMLSVTDGAVMSAQADGALLVVRAGRTSRNQVVAAASTLEAVDARILGCVLTMSKS